MNITAVFMETPEGEYTAFIEEFPRMTTGGKTLEEARNNLRLALEEVLMTNKMFVDEMIAGGHRVIKEPFLWEILSPGAGTPLSQSSTDLLYSQTTAKQGLGIRENRPNLWAYQTQDQQTDMSFEQILQTLQGSARGEQSVVRLLDERRRDRDRE